MIWVDREVQKLKNRQNAIEWVDDMKTPSGRVHVGALRGVVIHDLVYKALLENNIKAKFTYVFNDLDPMDAIPSYIKFSQWQKYEGVPLYKIPSPEKGYASFAEFYAKEFQHVFESINCHPEIIWSSKLYLSGQMNAVIREVLDNAKTVRTIYSRIAKAHKADDWYPFQVVCENCGKVGTTVVYDWDGKHVFYHCQPQLVVWAKGCGHKGKITPFDGHGKLPWKIDWPAHWKVMGVTIEGSGKDHMSSGGSYDFASAICREVLHIEPPYAIPYEWFTIGGRKMSSSKGIGSSAKEVAQILPADVLRFLIVRTPIATALDFNPYGETILNLFDDYDRCLEAHFTVIEKKIPSGKPGEVILEFARIIELSEVRPLPQKRIFLPRFRTVVNLLKSKAALLEFFEKQKGNKLNAEEKSLLEEREIFAQVYLKSYAAAGEKLTFLARLPANLSLTANQKKFLNGLRTNLKPIINPPTRDELQNIVF
ncbi:lysine--tRNA ligase [Candidatus Roizmanbacteria bacterium]|nr:lysine--tRNA ligase [Candidatus Roizmanbacteria bacterium]